MKKIFSVIFIACFFITAVFSEQIQFGTYGVMIDLPDGFQLTDSNWKDRYLFKSEILPCELQVSFDAKKRFSNTLQAVNNITAQLHASKKDAEFLWCEKQGRFSTIDFQLSEAYRGWVLVLELPNGWLTITAYSKKTDAALCEAMLISALDGVFTSQGSFYVPGPVTACLYPRTAPVKQTVTFDGSTLQFFADRNDGDANKSVVDREFELLTHYLRTNYAITAWQRYYRCIFRDAWKRLQSFSFEVKNDLSGKKLLADKAATVKKVLEFVQNFTYVRDPDGADFVDLVTAASQRLGDCDTRSLLMNIILAQLGIHSVTFISPEFSHAICGVAVTGKGARLVSNRISYLVAETTAHVAPGQIAADIADPSKWFAVELYGLPPLK